MADNLARLLIVLSLFNAISMPFVEYVPSHTLQLDPWPPLILGEAASFSVALGAYCLIKRRLFGLPLVALPSIYIATASLLAAGIYLVLVLAILYPPFFLAWSEHRQILRKPT